MIGIELLTRLLFPPKCVLCGSLLKEQETDLCRACRINSPVFLKKKTNLQFLDSFTAVWYYEANVRKSLLRYKFGNRRSYADVYGRLLAMRLLTDYPEGFDMISWIPVSTRRKLKRGYDQVELLAKAVGRELKMQPIPLLKKIRHNPPQSGLSSASERQANVIGVYRLKANMDLTGKRVLILDDILTTGATAGEAAKMLRYAGAKEVHCAAIAASRK